MAFGTPKLVEGCHPNNSTNTVAHGLSNLRATAHSAPLHDASATSVRGSSTRSSSASLPRTAITLTVSACGAERPRLLLEMCHSYDIAQKLDNTYGSLGKCNIKEP